MASSSAAPGAVVAGSSLAASTTSVWLGTGLGLFGVGWVIQFIASKRAGKPVIPRVFWYMSVVGSMMTLSYFLFSAKQDSVGVLQNLFPMFTAGYSLYLDIKHRGWHRDRAQH